MSRECSTNGDNRDAYRVLVGKLEGKRSLARTRHRWVDNNNNNNVGYLSHDS
jgi:hypothetical protein